MPNPNTHLSQIRIYPIKSIKGIEMSSTWVEKQGLCFDRRFMVADFKGDMVTARDYHQLLLVKAALQPNGLILSAPDAEALSLQFDQFENAEIQCQVWNDSFVAYSTSTLANQWFSAIIDKPVQLLFTGAQSNRQRTKISTNVSFADGYPLLLISQASLDELNQRSPESIQHQMAQFRPNIVVNDTNPFAEDSWKRFRIGEVEFEVVKPCMRCVMTTVDSQTGKADANNEPLKTLSTFRADKSGGIFFGQNVIAKNEGMISVGDKVEVLETQESAIYSNVSFADPEEIQALTITINDQSFTGDNQSSILDQAENAGVALPSSCRAGFCGSCKITLESGRIIQPESAGLLPKDIENNKVLACQCIPQTDVKLKL